jgi:hypothetical protein
MAQDTDRKCGDCLHFGFTKPEPPYGHGSNLWCKLHKKRITGAGCKGKDFVDRYEKKWGDDD